MHERLYRSRDERVLFGVCGGIAERLDVDPSIVRIVFALLVLSAGVGLGLYIIMALVVPEEPLDDMPFTAPMPPPDAGIPIDVNAPTGSEPGGGVSDAAMTGAAAMSAPQAGAATAAGQPMSRHEQRRATRAARRARGDDRGAMVIGAILIIVGTWFLLRRYLPVFTDDFFGPLVLVGLGLVVLIGALGRGTTNGSSPRPR